MPTPAVCSRQQRVEGVASFPTNGSVVYGPKNNTKPPNTNPTHAAPPNNTNLRSLVTALSPSLCLPLQVKMTTATERAMSKGPRHDSKRGDVVSVAA